MFSTFVIVGVHPSIIFLMVEAEKVQAARMPPVTINWGQNNFCAVGGTIYIIPL
jgi:hypothetical protein